MSDLSYFYQLIQVISNSHAMKIEAYRRDSDTLDNLLANPWQGWPSSLNTSTDGM